MRSIKYKSELSEAFDQIKDYINLNIEKIKQYPGDSTFGRNKLDDYHPYTTDKSSDNKSNILDYEDLSTEDKKSDYNSKTASGIQDDDNYLRKVDEISKDAIDLQKCDEGTRSFMANRRYSKNVSRDRLREAIVWSEILGPPVSKRRHNRTRKSKSYKQI